MSKYFLKPESLRSDSVGVLRFVFLLCFYLASFSIPGVSAIATVFTSNILGFSVGGIFMLCGYFVLGADADFDRRINYAIVRTAILFVITFVIYLALLYFEYLSQDRNLFAEISKTIIFEFLVLNYWTPSLGGNIWIIQAALYALILLKIFHSIGMFQYDWLLTIVLFVVAVLVGEFSHIINLQIKEYTCISGNFLTRAIPYMLLGRLLYKANQTNIFSSLRNWVWVAILVFGAFLSFIEIALLYWSGHLVYYFHAIGYIPMCFAVGMLAIKSTKVIPFGRVGHLYAALLYFITNPISTLTMIVIFTNFVDDLELCNRILAYQTPIALAVSLAFGAVIVLLYYTITRKKEKNIETTV